MPTAANRNQIVKSPGKLILGTGEGQVVLYSSTGWSAEIQETNVMLPSQLAGDYDQLVTGRLVRIEGQPTQFTAAAIAALYKHGAVRMGGSIIGSTDMVGALHTNDGKKRVFKNIFVYQEPAVQCMAGKTVFGNVVFYAILPLNGNAGLLSEFYALSDQSWDPSDWDAENEITPGWDFSWSGESDSAWDEIWTRDPGVTLTPASGLDEDMPNSEGLANVTLNNYGVTITASALNISEALVLAAIGNLRPGQRKSTTGRVLKLNAKGGGAYIRAYNAVLQPDYKFNAVNNNTVVADLSWKTFPAIAAGVRGTHLLVTTEDPDAVPPPTP